MQTIKGKLKLSESVDSEPNVWTRPWKVGGHETPESPRDRGHNVATVSRVDGNMEYYKFNSIQIELNL